VETNDERKLRVRSALGSDAAAIAGVHVYSWQVGYQGLLPQPLLDGLSAESRRQWWSGRLGELGARDRVMVPERGRGVVGFAAIGPSRDPDADRDVAEVYAIYVHPDQWRGGVGRALMTRALDELRTAGFSATLWVLDSNARGRRFYEAGGWRRDGASKADVVGREGDGDGGVDVIEVRYRIAIDH
jgi:GNAT superfamily N-acetyltransferase